jgi:hypothetical protein
MADSAVSGSATTALPGISASEMVILAAVAFHTHDGNVSPYTTSFGFSPSYVSRA